VNFSIHSSKGHLDSSRIENCLRHLLLFSCFFGTGTDRSRKGSKQKDLKCVVVIIDSGEEGGRGGREEEGGGRGGREEVGGGGGDEKKREE
jgi:hypothetical protein